VQQQRSKNIRASSYASLRRKIAHSGAGQDPTTAERFVVSE
jgi:hypothetical protein